MTLRPGLVVIAVSIWCAHPAMATHESTCSYGPDSVNEQGRWEHVGNTDILAVHGALLRNGNVLLFGGSEHIEQSAGKVGSEVDKTRIYDPMAKTFTTPIIPAPPDFTDVFCSGSAQVADGRILVAGGMGGWKINAGDHTGHFPGTRATWMFVPTGDGLGYWERKDDMKGGARWYPTLVTLPNGGVLAMSGHPAEPDRHLNNIPEVFTAGGWRTLSRDVGNKGPSTNYPHAYVLPQASTSMLQHPQNAEVFFASKSENNFYHIMNLTPPFWHNVIGLIFGPESRDEDRFVYEPSGDNVTHYATTSVLLPLDPAKNYEPKVLLMGGEKAKLIEVRGGPWRDTAGQRQLMVTDGNTIKAPRRRFASSVILPTGHVMLTGGVSSPFPHPDTGGIREVELFNPKGETWSVGPKACAVRNYHSIALLLPDGSVLAAGGNHNAGIDSENRELRVEVFKPWYFNHPRPVLQSVPRELLVDMPFVVWTRPPSPIVGNEQPAQPAPVDKISQLVLVRTGSTTHGLNTDQRLVRLSVDVTNVFGFSILRARTPPNTTVAPPGYYLMFAITEGGIPSRGEFVRITQRPGAFLENEPIPGFQRTFPFPGSGPGSGEIQVP